MSVESASYINQLNTAWPLASDFISEGDDHIRLTKTVLKTTFPNVAGAVSASDVELSYCAGLTSAAQTQFAGKGDVAGQTWTGAHVFPSTTTIGTITPTKFGHLATITSDVQAQLNGKANATGQTWTGAHDFTGASVAVPTPPANDSSSSVASTAFVTGAVLTGTLPGQAGNSGKFITTDGTTPSWAAIPPPPSPFPSQTGKANFSAMTDGTSVYWGLPQFTEAAVALAGSGTIDLSLGGRFTDTVSANRTFTVSNALAGSVFTLELNHTAGTITLPSGSVWANGVAPTLTAGKRHMLYFQKTQIGTAGWYVSALVGFSA